MLSTLLPRRVHPRKRTRWRRAVTSALGQERPLAAKPTITLMTGSHASRDRDRLDRYRRRYDPCVGGISLRDAWQRRGRSRLGRSRATAYGASACSCRSKTIPWRRLASLRSHQRLRALVGRLCRSHSARREAGRSSGGVSNEIRNGREPQDCQGARPCESAATTARLAASTACAVPGVRCGSGRGLTGPSHGSDGGGGRGI